MQYELRPPARLSASSILAIGVAIGSFVVSCMGHGWAGLLMALGVPLSRHTALRVGCS